MPDITSDLIFFHKTANFIQLINFGKIILIITNTINLTIIISIFYLLNYL